MRYRLDIHTDERARQERLEADVRRGLTAWQKSLPPKYFYDRAGSLLFERITELPEYYPTRTEAALLGEIVPGLIGEIFPRHREIGAGSSEKTRLILNAATAGGRAIRYVPLDVDRLTLESTAARLTRDYPALSVHAVVGDFERDLAHVPPPRGRRLALFLGSTIGNLDAPERRRLLAGLRALLPDPGDRLLLGVDLVKDVKVLKAAYDDAAGRHPRFHRHPGVINHAGRQLSSPRPSPSRLLQRGGLPHREAPGGLPAQTVKLGRLAHRPLPGPSRASGPRTLQSSRATASRRFCRGLARSRAVARGPRNYFALALAARVSAADGAAYAQPTPPSCYVHERSDRRVSRHEGAGSPAPRSRATCSRCLPAIRAVAILTLGEQLERVVAQGDTAPFALALGIGAPGSGWPRPCTRERSGSRRCPPDRPHPRGDGRGGTA